ncbi:hypothetical protein LJR234_006213 [Mesorhizobium amorphae]|uniref:hypothetical protein n=1 Tax=Mesorhizobium amorphae TaxID=71433 RepID=UPI003ED148C1
MDAMILQFHQSGERLGQILIGRRHLAQSLGFCVERPFGVCAALLLGFYAAR